MSVVLNGSSHYLNANASMVYPFTISIWFKTSDLTVDGTMMDIGGVTTGSSVDHNFVYLKGTVAGDPIRARTYSNPSGTHAESSTGCTVDTWHHALAVFAADNDRRIYLDGGSKVTDTTVLDGDTSLPLYILGCLGNGASIFFKGKLAEAGVWGSALTDVNAVTLAAGANPQTVDSGNLLEYWSLISDANSDGGSIGTSLNEQGSPSYDAVDHPSVSSGYAEMSGSINAVSGVSGDMSIFQFAEMSASISGVSSVSGAMAISGFPIGSLVASREGQHLVAIANDTLYYED